MALTALIPAVGEPTEIETIETCMVTPNIIRLTFKDEPSESGGLFDTGETQAEAVDTYWREKTHPVLGTTQLAIVQGLDREVLRFTDRRPTEYVDRAPGKNPANWAILGRGDITIEDVFYWNELDQQGYYSGEGVGAGSKDVDLSQSWLHHFELKLSTNLESGDTLHIRPPADWNYADLAFAFDDREMRAAALHVSFAGHRPGDTGKVGYLGIWVAGEANEGAIEFDGFTAFEVIDDTGQTVWTGTIPEPFGPTTAEPRDVFPSTPPGSTGQTLRRYGSAMPSSRLTVVGVTAGTPGVIELAAGQGALIENDEVLICGTLAVANGSSLTGLTQSAYITVKNKSGDTFECYTTAASPAPVAVAGTFDPAAMEGGDTNCIFKTFLANSTLTYTYQLDFSDFDTGDGIYRLRAPGLGVSDPFPINESVWHDAAGAFAKGEYNQRHGCALDGRFGFTRPAMLRNGQRGTVIRKSNFPILFSDQGGIVSPRIELSKALRSSWVTVGEGEAGTEIDAGGEWIDAGDWDVFPRLHLPSAYLMLQAYGLLPPAGRATNFNTPLSSEAHLYLGGTHDHSELDDAPEILHMVHYALYWLLRCQEADGRVPGGIQGHNEANMNIPGYGLLLEASPYALTPQYTYAPDHLTNFIAAGMFAAFGRTLIEGGWTVLGNAYLTAAELAWDWAEDVYRHLARIESTTSTAIGTGSKAFAIAASAAAPFVVGDSMRVESRADTNNYMEGAVTAISGTSVTVDVASVGGSGTFTDWDIKLAAYDLFYYYDDLTQVRRSTVVSGDTTSGSATITNIADTSDVVVGDHVTGSGIPTNARVASKTGTTITLNALTDQIKADGEYIGTLANVNATATASGVSITCRPFGGAWSDADYKTKIEVCQSNARAPRTFAAAALARATGEAGYLAHFERTYNSNNFLGWDGLGRAEYLGADYTGITGANSTIVTSIRGNILQYADIDLAKSESTQAYRTITGGAVPSDYSQHFSATTLYYVLGALGIETDSAKKTRYRKMMECCVATVLGANQWSKSYCVGFGERYVKNALHVDGYVMLSRAPDGITVYGPALDYRFDGSPASVVWASQISYSSLNHASKTGDTSYRANQIIEPSKAMRPGTFLHDCRWLINETEFGMPSILNNLIMAYVLNGHDAT